MISINMGELFRQLRASHLSSAIKEFKQLGRRRFLDQHGFDRSSKFYLLLDGQIYDTKSLLAATYFHAYKRRLSNERFGGGSQTVDALERIREGADEFKGAKIFEDKLGELSFQSDEYNRLSEPYASIRHLGFSKWISLTEYGSLRTGFLPGIYIIGHKVNSLGRLDKLDNKIVYVGETVSQNLHKRLYQFSRALENKSGHSGGATLHRLKFPSHQLSFSIRSFTLSLDADRNKAESQRSSLIRYLERKLLYEYVASNGKYPVGNRR